MENEGQRTPPSGRKARRKTHGDGAQQASEPRRADARPGKNIMRTKSKMRKHSMAHEKHKTTLEITHIAHMSEYMHTANTTRRSYHRLQSNKKCHSIMKSYEHRNTQDEPRSVRN